MMYGFGGTCGGFFGFGWLFQILIFVLFFLVVWWLIRGNPQLFQAGKEESAKDILKRRLAKGEISKKEYEDLRKEIE